MMPHFESGDLPDVELTTGAKERRRRYCSPEVRARRIGYLVRARAVRNGRSLTVMLTEYALACQSQIVTAEQLYADLWRADLTRYKDPRDRARILKNIAHALSFARTRLREVTGERGWFKYDKLVGGWRVKRLATVEGRQARRREEASCAI